MLPGVPDNQQHMTHDETVADYSRQAGQWASNNTVHGREAIDVTVPTGGSKMEKKVLPHYQENQYEVQVTAASFPLRSSIKAPINNRYLSWLRDRMRTAYLICSLRRRSWS